MAGWYRTGLSDATDHGYIRVRDGRIERCNSNDDGAERYVTCDYCGKRLSYGERCDCEESKW